MFWNCYAYTRTGERVVIDLGLPRAEAEQRCEAEAQFIARMGDALTRYGDSWMNADYEPRVGLFSSRLDPFNKSAYGLQWLPDGDVILEL